MFLVCVEVTGIFSGISSGSRVQLGLQEKSLLVT